LEREAVRQRFAATRSFRVEAGDEGLRAGELHVPNEGIDHDLGQPSPVRP